ncbi:MAG: T9SS type A sorting domain-containing protein [Bacteroidetes bacterium]|nr:T9SS type A sorting domain-containing protein [Bacteroidota bacterium]
MFLGSGATSILCNGGASTITISAIGGTGLYTGTGTFSQLAGTTNYIVTDANGCSANTDVTVTEPSAIIPSSSFTTILCSGGTSTVTLSATGGTGALAGTGIFTQTAGTTNYVVTDANGCSVNTDVIITEPSAIIPSSTYTAILCNGGTSTVTVTATGGTGTLTGTGIFTQPAGTVVYTVTDANSCTATTSPVITEPAVIATTQTVNLCSGQTVTIGTNTYSTPGTYTDIMPAFNTCDSTVTTTVTTTTIDVSTVSAGLLITANSLTGTFQWLDCNLGSAPIATETNQSYTAAGSGDFAVQITDNGCVDTSACVNINATGINNNSFQNNLSVSPNPTNGVFNITINNANYSELLISIFDLQGKEVFSSTDLNVNGNYNKQINLEDLSKGVYYIKFNGGSQIKIQKLIIQ